MRDTYKEHAKKLRQTGGGIGDEGGASGPAELPMEGGGEQLRFYISADGPDARTSAELVNPWVK
jgi:hypothetical protein